MPTITFRGAFIRYVDMRYEPKSKAVYLKLNMTAAYSKPVREELNWAELPETSPDMGLDGDFTATEFTMIPNGLDASAFNLDATSMESFSVHRVTSKTDKEKTEEELRFLIVTPDKHAAGKLAKYLDVVGVGLAQLKVKYNAQSAIENEASDQQEKLISEEQAADTAEGADEPEGKRGARAKKRAAQVN